MSNRFPFIPGHLWDSRYNLRPNDYDPDYPDRKGYGMYPSTDLTDEAQWLGLGPIDTEEMPDRRQLNHPWGKSVKLTAETPSLTFVSTPTARRPIAIAVQARFSLDGVTYTPNLPVGYAPGSVTVRVIRSIDYKAGSIREDYEVDPGAALPFCVLIARALTISATIVSEAALTPLFISIVACPVETIDCVDLVGAQSLPGGTESEIVRVTPTAFVDPTAPITAPGIRVLFPNPTRTALMFQNHAETNCYIAFVNDDGGAAPPSDTNPRWSILLPPLVTPGDLGVSNYVMDTNVWKGSVWVVFDAADGDPPPGYLMVTEMDT